MKFDELLSGVEKISLLSSSIDSPRGDCGGDGYFDDRVVDIPR